MAVSRGALLPAEHETLRITYDDGGSGDAGGAGARGPMWLGTWWVAHVMLGVRIGIGGGTLGNTNDCRPKRGPL
jgi:hypothetical protein